MIKVMVMVAYLSGGGAEHVARNNLECLLSEKTIELAALTCDTKWENPCEITKFLLKDYRNDNSKLKNYLGVLGLSENYRLTSSYLNEFQPDIIHIHDFTVFTPSTMKAIHQYKRKSQCRIIMTHHNYSCICTNDALYNYKKSMVCSKCLGKNDISIVRYCCTGSYVTSVAKYLQKKIFRKYLVGLVDWNISPSVFLKDQLIKAGIKNDVSVVYNPCIDMIYEENYNNKKNSIVFFGRTSREKGILEFLKDYCLSECEVPFLIIGDGNVANIIKEIIKDNPTRNITFINKFLYTDELYEYIKDAKYMVLPSVWYENSPVSIVEGINLSIIPIVNGIGGMKELINLFNIGYLIDIKDRQSVISFLNKIENNDLVSEDSIERSRDILSKFTIENYKRSILKIYSQVKKV
jgi:glycosyltransferase involved in cell wall biosynthesis